MKRLEIKYNTSMVERDSGNIDTEATLQAIIDRVNELSNTVDKAYCPACLTTLAQEATKKDDGSHAPKRFSAEDIQIEELHGMTRLSVYCTKAEAQAALEALLNL